MATGAAILQAQQKTRRSTGVSQGFITGIVAFLDVTACIVPGLVIHFGYVADPVGRLVPSLGAIVLVTLLLVLGLHTAGQYRFDVILRPSRHIGKLLMVAMLSFLVLVLLGFALKVSGEFSRIWLFSWMLCTIAILIALRFAAAGTLRKLAASGRIGRRIVVYGADEQGRKLVRRIAELEEPWNQVVGLFDDRTSRVSSLVEGLPVMGGLSDLVAWGKANRPDEVLVALPWGAEERLLQILHTLAVLPANVRLSPEFTRMDSVQGRTSYQFGVPMLNAYEKPLQGWGRIWKRGFDAGLAMMITVLTLPLLVLIAIAIKIDSSGPILFRQRRYGFNNKLVGVYKFRTMVQDSSDLNGDRLTERHDPRVTRVGAFLRRFSLDELPQLLNVMNGEMSLIGPRPHAIRTTAGGRQCNEVVDQYAVRHKVKPGITGWAQVNGWRGTMETEEQLVKRLEYDLYYINNWSPILDIKILLLTAWEVVFRRDAY